MSFVIAIVVLPWAISDTYHKLYVNIIEASFVLNIQVQHAISRVHGYRDINFHSYLSMRSFFMSGNMCEGKANGDEDKEDIFSRSRDYYHMYNTGLS